MSLFWPALAGSVWVSIAYVVAREDATHARYEF